MEPVLLPFLAIFLLALAFMKHGLRLAILYAALACGLLIALSTEILSLFHLVNFWTIAGLWTLTIIAALTFIIRNRTSIRIIPDLAPASALKIDSRLMIVSVIFIAAVTAVIAFYGAPNTWDSMTYHLARIIHWMQNKSVEFYPTNILRQLHQNPWSEYAMMQLLILHNGSDRFVNFVQWFCMFGSLAGVTLIAKQLGADPRGQVMAAVFAATIPMGILQASSTQNDYAAAFWLVCFVYFGIEFKRAGKLKHAAAAGAALGLAILTKATAYLFAFPFLVWFSLEILIKDKFKAIRPLATIAALVLLLNCGHYIRNYNLYGSPLGPGQESETGNDYSNDIFTAPAITSNVMRNFAVHLSTPDYRVNVALDRFFYKLHDWIGISPNDPRTTWSGTEFHIGYLSYYDGKAGSPLHIWIVILVIPIFIAQKRQKSEETFYLLALLGAFLFFASYLKWQSWHSRLHLPLFALWSPFIGRTLSQFRVRWLTSLCMFALAAASFLWLFHNETHPLFGKDSIFTASRARQYMIRNKSLYRPFVETTDILKRSSCSNIGLMTDWDGWEYPLWVMLRGALPQVHIEHVNVDNVSGIYERQPPFNSFEPCAVVMIAPQPPGKLEVRGAGYILTQTEGVVSVYFKEP